MGAGPLSVGTAGWLSAYARETRRNSLSEQAGLSLSAVLPPVQCLELLRTGGVPRLH